MKKACLCGGLMNWGRIFSEETRLCLSAIVTIRRRNVFIFNDRLVCQVLRSRSKALDGYPVG